MSNPELSLIIPVYNEEKNLSIFLESLDVLYYKLIDKGINTEIIFIDDGSKDKSISLIKAYGKGKIIKHKRNLGYGMSLRSGFYSSIGEYLAIIPADNQFDAQDLYEYIDYRSRNKIVCLYRAKRKDSWLRKIISYIYRSLLLFKGLKIKDPNWVKIIPKRLVKDLKATGPFIDAEILFRARKIGVNIISFPVKHYERRFEKAKGFSLHTIILALRDVIRIIKGVKN